MLFLLCFKVTVCALCLFAISMLEHLHFLQYFAQVGRNAPYSIFIKARFKDTTLTINWLAHFFCE